jgi:hypothetical protein
MSSDRAAVFIGRYLEVRRVRLRRLRNVLMTNYIPNHRQHGREIVDARR